MLLSPSGSFRPLLCSCFTSFFFSSRRRHTRSLCDWSSDVCSSDLHSCEPRSHSCERSLRGTQAARRQKCRSEERRVGKECIPRWPRGSYKQQLCLCVASL